MDNPTIYEKLIRKEAKLAVIGLGYVGLPIALEFARHLSVIGFDINEERVAMMRNGEDPSRELPNEEFVDRDIHFTANPAELKDACFFIIAVPTPVDDYKVPNLRPLVSASTNLGKVLKKGDYFVFESTVYPGCTEEECIPILEKESGLKAIEDFKYGYSPERINPGDKVHTITKITKVVSGCDEESLDLIAKVYEIIIEAGVFRAKGVKVAEAAKVIENTQRDLNIALMNELSLIFDKMGINTHDVLEAAGTKWNFLKFYPGLVGGHCIGVDPYYLTYKSIQLGYKPDIILSGRKINDQMAYYIAKKAVQHIIQMGKKLNDARVLVMGITFKENVSDIRNTKVTDLVKELQSFYVHVDITDPYASSEDLHEEYGLKLVDKVRDDYDCIIYAVKHDDYIKLKEEDFLKIANENALFIDVKGMYNHQFEQLTYWGL